MAFKLSFKIGRMAPKEKISVGLDIGTYTVKVIKIKHLQDSAELVWVSSEPLTLDPVEVLKKIKQAQNIDSVNIAFSGPATVIRNINLPKMTAAELKQAFKFEVQKHIPFPVAEVNLDGNILKDDLPDNKMLVLLAAVKKESVNQRLKILEDAGLKVNVADLASLALVNAFNFNYAQDESLKHKVVALLNMGAAITSVNIVEDGVPRLSRDIQIGGNSLTQKIADTFGIDFKSAENAKINPEGDQYTRMIAALDLIFASLASEIRTSFDYYESQSASSVGKIFISGGGSLFMGFKDKLKVLLNIETDYWDPFNKINIPSGIDSGKIKALSGQLAVAVGLALRK